jgi:hypothetical protein
MAKTSYSTETLEGGNLFGSPKAMQAGQISLEDIVRKDINKGTWSSRLGASRI